MPACACWSRGRPHAGEPPPAVGKDGPQLPTGGTAALRRRSTTSRRNASPARPSGGTPRPEPDPQPQERGCTADGRVPPCSLGARPADRPPCPSVAPRRLGGGGGPNGRVDVALHAGRSAKAATCCRSTTTWRSWRASRARCRTRRRSLRPGPRALQDGARRVLGAGPPTRRRRRGHATAGRGAAAAPPPRAPRRRRRPGRCRVVGSASPDVVVVEARKARTPEARPAPRLLQG